MASFVDVDPLVHRKQQRAKLHALQRQLNRLNEERHRLRHDLASQKLDRLMTGGVNSPLRDLKRGITVDAKQLKNEIGRQLPLIAEARRAQELLAAYQLTGCTTFIYKGVYLSIRLDTFYNRRYYEPYYLILDGPMIRWTTLPWFITSTSDVENALLPGSLDVGTDPGISRSTNGLYSKT
ncbi:hypothetical protein [Absidia glauca]|uniref:Uncharacterized protein n=1 Tax=Absidia glauca TaxID=4829 RepID=A0A163MNX3_ABSGL|nr:hypothetical protein [Absidia glauca]